MTEDTLRAGIDKLFTDKVLPWYRLDVETGEFPQIIVLPWHRAKLIGRDGHTIKKLATEVGAKRLVVVSQPGLACVTTRWAAEAHPLLEPFATKDGTAEVAFIGKKAYAYKMFRRGLGKAILDKSIEWGPGRGRAVVFDASKIFESDSLTVDDLISGAELVGATVPDWVLERPVNPFKPYTRGWF